MPTPPPGSPAHHGVPLPLAPGTPPDPGAALCVRGLRRAFGDVVAVDGLDLDVAQGSFFGLLGPNGAGKTTSLRMVTGLLRPNAGTVLVHGQDVWQDPAAVKARIGVLPEDLRLFDRLRGRELVTYTGLLRRMEPAIVEARTEQLLRLCDLEDAADQFVVDYSRGMRKKVALAMALLHAPRVLFLDEPFEGVDPVSSRAIRHVLERFTRGGGTVVMSSHIISLVEQLCDHVAIVHAGRVATAGTRSAVTVTAPLEEVFVRLVGRPDRREEDIAWLDSSSA